MKLTPPALTLRHFSLLPLLALATLLLLLAACSGDDDEPAEYAEPRPYAGILVGLDDWFGSGDELYVATVDPGGPAAVAGIEDMDFIRTMDGREIESEHDYYAYLESREVGSVVEYAIDRLLVDPPHDINNPEFERLTLSVDLVEEPVGDAGLRTPFTALRDEDQLRLGFYLGEITRPVAEHYGIDGPEGVYIASSFLRLLQGNEDFDEGDVITELAGRRVNTLAQVQSVVDGLDEDEPIEVVVRRDGQEATRTLDNLGPLVQDANHLPAAVRQRLKTAIDRGDLHPDRVATFSRIYRPSGPVDPPVGASAAVIGAVTALAGDSLTLEEFATGDEWTFELGPNAPELRVGEYVYISARQLGRADALHSLAEPVRP